jgi:hypothetical protein
MPSKMPRLAVGVPIFESADLDGGARRWEAFVVRIGITPRSNVSL